MDDELWVRLIEGWTPDPAWRWTVIGSAHTHRGHVHVEHPDSEWGRSINLGEVAELSPAARLWWDGFLAGQEPGLWEFLGRDDELDTHAGDADIERWQLWCRAFRRRGFLPPLAALPPADPVLAGFDDPTPWCFVGGLYRLSDRTGWRVADPQPVAFDPERPPFWPGSVCEGRGHCDLTQYGAVSVCEDCHQVN